VKLVSGMEKLGPARPRERSYRSSYFPPGTCRKGKVPNYEQNGLYCVQRGIWRCSMDLFLSSRNDDDANQRYAQPYRHGPGQGLTEYCPCPNHCDGWTDIQNRCDPCGRRLAKCDVVQPPSAKGRNEYQPKNSSGERPVLHPCRWCGVSPVRK
jgi:hypothetical protein